MSLKRDIPSMQDEDREAKKCRKAQELNDYTQAMIQVARCCGEFNPSVQTTNTTIRVSCHKHELVLMRNTGKFGMVWTPSDKLISFSSNVSPPLVESMKKNYHVAREIQTYQEFLKNREHTLVDLLTKHKQGNADLSDVERETIKHLSNIV